MRRVSSQATRSAVLRISTARKLISPKLPIGVPIIYSIATKESITGMGSYLKLLGFVLAGLLLLWFFFSFYIKSHKKHSEKDEDRSMKLYKETIPPDGASGSGGIPGSGNATSSGGASGSDANPPMKKYKGTEDSGGLMICPLCLFKMENSEMIKTTAFPPMIKGAKNRLMHIHGCVYCIDGKRERICPVCGKAIGVKDFLVARIFDRSIRRSHVHVLGCTQCRPLKTM